MRVALAIITIKLVAPSLASEDPYAARVGFLASACG